MRSARRSISSRSAAATSLEDTFVGYLADAAGIDRSKKVERPPPEPADEAKACPRRSASISGRLWAYARRETVELLRDPIRLAFAVLGPIILMVAFGYGISFDIENLQMAAFDQDDTPQSRQLLDGFPAPAISRCSRRSLPRKRWSSVFGAATRRSSSKCPPGSEMIC